MSSTMTPEQAMADERKAIVEWSKRRQEQKRNVAWDLYDDGLIAGLDMAAREIENGEHVKKGQE